MPAATRHNGVRRVVRAAWADTRVGTSHHPRTVFRLRPRMALESRAKLPSHRITASPQLCGAFVDRQRAGARGCQASASATRRNKRQRSARVCCHAVSRLPAEFSCCEAKFQTTTWWQIERLSGRSSSGLRAVTALISLAGV